MRPVDRSDRLLDVVHAAHDFDSLDEFRAGVPELLHYLVDADLVAYQEVDLPARATSAILRGVDDDAAPAELDALLARLLTLLPQHPLFRRIVTTGDGSARAISDMWNRRRYLASPLYREVYQGLGTEDQLVIALPAPAPLVIGLPVSRGRWGFTDEERRVLDVVRPHLSQARANLVVLDRARRRAGRDADHLAAAGIALVTADAAGAVEGADAVLASLARSGILRGRRWADAAESWWATVRDPRQQGRTPPLRAGGSGDRVILRAVSTDTVVVRRIADIDPSSLRALGLSPREADILARMANGRTTTNALVAGTALARSTVLRHLEAINRKLGVHTRAEAVAVAFDAAAIDDGMPFA